MKRNLLVGVILFITSLSFAQNKGDNFVINPKQKVNFGVRGGFNSSMYFVDEFRILDVTIKDIENNYKVGYFGALFMRINVDRHFLQPEIQYAVSKSEIAFDKRGSKHPEVDPEYVYINATIRSVEVPVLYGYNFVKSPPYGMSFFVGPTIKYIWKKRSYLEFDNFDQKDMNEDLYPIHVSLLGGIGVTISNIFFDFTYELGLHNISKSITYDNANAEGTENISNIILKRRNNILSFSLGVIF